MSNYIPLETMNMITYPCPNPSQWRYCSSALRHNPYLTITNWILINTTNEPADRNRENKHRHCEYFAGNGFYWWRKPLCQDTSTDCHITFLCLIIDLYKDVNLSFNPLRAKFFRGNINIYLHFISLLHIDKTHVLKILPQVRPGPTYST